MKIFLQIVLIALGVIFSLGIVGSKDSKERYCFLAAAAVFFVLALLSFILI